MTKILNFIFICVFLLISNVAIADDGGTCSADDLTTCSENYFCKKHTLLTGVTYSCVSCADDTNGQYTLSDAGSDNIDDCYKMCSGNKPNFRNGTWDPDAATAHYNNDCWTSTANITCNDGYYLNTTDTPTCKRCIGPDDCGNQGSSCQFTGHGTDNDNSSCPWEMNCPNNPGFQHGTWAPDAGTITYSGTGEPPSCSWTNTDKIQCENESYLCSGYHKETDTCVSNKKSCDNGRGAQFYENGSWGDTCYVERSSCGNNQGFDDLDYKYRCGNKIYGQCYNKTENCAANSDITQRCDGTVNGNITITQTYLVPNRDYSNCTCTRSTTIQNGTGTETCHFNSSGYLINDCRPDISTCNAGYYEVNSTCTPVERGYYSDGSGKERTRCPFASTSDGGPDATAATQCYFTSIRDNNNKNTDPWEIPVISNNRAYITQKLIESSGNTSTTPSSVEGN